MNKPKKGPGYGLVILDEMYRSESFCVIENRKVFYLEYATFIDYITTLWCGEQGMAGTNRDDLIEKAACQWVIKQLCNDKMITYKGIQVCIK